MAKFNISQAAKLYGKDRSSIQRKIKQGKISVSTNEKGHKEIDLTELIRVFGEPPKVDTVETHVENSGVQQPDTVAATPFLHDKISMLEARVEELVKEREREREEYHEREEWLKKKVDTQALLLEDKREKEIEKPSSDRWLLWGLGIFTLIVGVTAMVAIYYLIQSGV